MKYHILVFSTILFLKYQAQYYSGFDTSTEQNGWVEYKKEAQQFSHWGYSNNAYSPSNSISHDYSPSTGIGLTDNWYVSPGFSGASPSQLDSIRYAFSGFSTPDVGDTVALYLLLGDSDPDNASSRVLLFDFRGSEYITDNTYRIKTNLTFPVSQETAYLAIRYRNTDCSSKWLTVAFDNISISSNTVGINHFDNIQELAKLFPSPFTDLLHISVQTEAKLHLLDITGKEVLQKTLNKGDNVINIDEENIEEGTYIALIIDTYEQQIASCKIIKAH